MRRSLHDSKILTRSETLAFHHTAVEAVHVLVDGVSPHTARCIGDNRAHKQRIVLIATQTYSTIPPTTTGEQLANDRAQSDTHKRLAIVHSLSLPLSRGETIQIEPSKLATLSISVTSTGQMKIAGTMTDSSWPWPRNRTRSCRERRRTRRASRSLWKWARFLSARRKLQASLWIQIKSTRRLEL